MQHIKPCLNNIILREKGGSTVTCSPHIYVPPSGIVTCSTGPAEVTAKKIAI